jgi:VIT1/CCC1 family predicted Fe2+/Mn2+ transporter
MNLSHPPSQPRSAPSILRKRSRRPLDPIDRVSELLFGLIMVLTFTGSLSIAQADRDDVRAMLIGALGCNLAWGIIDAILFLMGCVAERSGKLATLHAVRAAADPSEAQASIAEALPPVVASVLEPSDLTMIHTRLLSLPEPPRRARLTSGDWFGALGVFLWVFVGTLPVVIPFMVMDDARAALRVSNGIAMFLLFLTGYTFGRCAGRNPWLTGGGMLLLGGALVAMTIALGG